MKYCMWPEAPETRRGSITLQFLSSPIAENDYKDQMETLNRCTACGQSKQGSEVRRVRSIRYQ